MLKSGFRTRGPHIRREGTGFEDSIGAVAVEQRRVTAVGVTDSVFGYRCKCRVLLAETVEAKQFCLGRRWVHLRLMLATSAISEQAGGGGREGWRRESQREDGRGWWMARKEDDVIVNCNLVWAWHRDL